MTDVDVIISGGGPVGLGLAIDLAQRGVTPIVIEKYMSLQPIPKGQNMTQRSGEHFRAWGVSAEMRAASLIPREFGNSGLTAYGTLLGPYSYDWLTRGTVDAYYAAETERMPQYCTEQVLRDRAAALGIQVLYDWTLIGAEDNGDKVSVHLNETNGRQSKTLTGRFLVGCDGAGSTVRDLAGISQTVDERGRRMILAVFHAPALDTLLGDRFKGKAFFNILNPDLQGYWQFLGRVDLNGHWFFHMPVRLNDTIDSVDLPTLLERVVGAEFDLTVEHLGFWDLRFAHADSYRAGNVFIAGDAAHAHPPYGGYGVNTGFEDARNLAWKLAASIHGWGSDRLLNSYSTERHPVFASTRDHFIAKMIEDDATFTATHHPEHDRGAFEAEWDVRSKPKHEVSQFLPNYAGSPIVEGVGLSGARGEHLFAARAGHHLAPATLADGSNVYDHLSDDFTLILVNPDHNAQAYADRLVGASAVPVKILSITSTVEVDRWKAGAILVRPDHFIAYVVENSELPSGQIERAVGLKAP